MALPDPAAPLTASPTRTTLRSTPRVGAALRGMRAVPTTLWPVRLPDLTVVVPTRNEAPNIAPLLDEIATVGPQSVVFVDDSDDRTPQVIRSRTNRQVQLLHRSASERSDGLGGAVLLGFEASRTRYAAVMDGDLQHPPAVLADLWARLEEGVDVVVASRYRDAGSRDGLGGPVRRLVSSASNTAARRLFPRQLAGVSDPMSGMFAVNLATTDLTRLRPDGFKVLLELLVLAEPGTVAEVPYSFRARNAGVSKAGLREGMTYLRRLLALRRQARITASESGHARSA